MGSEKVVGVALSMSERRRLAAIENHLSAEDPRLAQMMADWSTGLWRRHLLELAVGAAASVAALVGGVLISAEVGGMLTVLGVLGLPAVLVVGLRMRRLARRPADKQNPSPERMPGHRPGTEDGYL